MRNGGGTAGRAAERQRKVKPEGLSQSRAAVTASIKQGLEEGNYDDEWQIMNATDSHP